MTSPAAEAARRRTFAIISHPDAGKTTLTEKFLLYGGALTGGAGSVKARGDRRSATSDWMELEQQRGISITSAALEFEIQGRTVDIQAYTRFLRQLEASPWVETVIPVSAQTVVEEERAVTAFTIRASFQRADSAYIRTVPFSQSVR